MPTRTSQRGFGLVEIMVGVVIGMIASVIMFQTFAVSESQKRTTTGAADAQSNGAIATFTMERDIKMAGWGLQNSSFAQCGSFYTYYDDKGGAIDDNATVGSSLLASVAITDGGDNPDAITIQYYGDPKDQDVKLSVTTLRSTMPQPSAELNVNSTYGCPVGSLAILRQGGNCTLIQITHVQDNALKLQHNPGDNGKYNPSAAYQNANGWPAYTQGATLQCFADLYRRTYSVSANKELELRQPDGAGGIETFQIVPQIMDLQAEYGIADAGGGQQIKQWVAATDGWAKPTITDVRRIKAVRIAVLARSVTYEKPEDGVTCTATTDDMADKWSTWAKFKTSKLPLDWKCYRYKAYELEVPLRNIIWAKT